MYPGDALDAINKLIKKDRTLIYMIPRSPKSHQPDGIYGFYKPGPFNFLSNMINVPIEYNGITYPSVENFFVASKTSPRNQDIKLKVAGMQSKDAKKFGRGRGIKLRKDWNKIKFHSMLYALRKKFNQDKYKALLLGTGNRYIEESNWWGDISMGAEETTGFGYNILGFMLMHIREELRQNKLFDFIYNFESVDPRFSLKINIPINEVG